MLMPGFAEAEAFSKRLEQIGNLHSDGHPILGLDSRDLLEITPERCPDVIFIPAHIWAPYFSLFDAYSSLIRQRNALKIFPAKSTRWKPASPPTLP